MKTILISAATFLVLNWLSTHPILFGIILYVALNWASYYSLVESDPKTLSCKEDFKSGYKQDGMVFPFFITLGGFIISLCFVVQGIVDGSYTDIKNLWKYFFKTDAPTIKFQSPIVIQKAVESGDKGE